MIPTKMQETQGRLVPLLHLISGVLEEYTSSALTQEDDGLVTLALMQRLAFRAVAHKQEQKSRNATQTPRLNADL